jgi:hypothetical protein
MTWTKAEHRQATKNGLWPSSLNIAVYLSTKTNSNEPTDIEFRAEDFQKYMENLKGTRYNRTTIPKAVKDLESKSQGRYVVLEEYGRGVWKLMCYPLAWVTENRKPKRESVPTQKPGNHMFSEQHKREEEEQQQQFIDKADELLKKIGLKFDRDALLKMWRSSGKSIERIVNAIKFVLHRNSKAAKPIGNPHGLLVDSLRYGWAENFDLYYEPELPTFSSRMQIDKFVSNLAQEVFPGKIPIPGGLYPQKN